MRKDASVSDLKGLVEAFEQTRGHLRGVAYRMLGSLSEADDAVQEAWLRLNRADVSEVENLRGWLTTVVAHVCLDMMRSRKSRREESMESQGADPVAHAASAADPEQETLLAEWTRWHPRNGWRLCCTTCSICRLTRLRRLSGGLPKRRDNWRAERGGKCAAGRWRSMRTARAIGGLSRHLLWRCAEGILTP